MFFVRTWLWCQTMLLTTLRQLYTRCKGRDFTLFSVFIIYYIIVVIYKMQWNYSHSCTSYPTEAFFLPLCGYILFIIGWKYQSASYFFIFLLHMYKSTCNNIKILHNKYIFVQFDFSSMLSVSSMFPFFNPFFLIFFFPLPFQFFEIASQCISGYPQTYCVDQVGLEFCILLLWHPYSTTTPSSMLLNSVNYLIYFQCIDFENFCIDILQFI